MKIILLGTQNYNWLIPMFLYLFRTYWGEDEIIYITDKPEKHVYQNFEMMQVPAYIEGEWDWYHWFSNGLMSICEYFENELLIIFLLDHFINRPVNLRNVYSLLDYMSENKNVVRGNLTVGTCLDAYGSVTDKYNDLDIVTVPPHHHHCSFGGGITFCPSIFNSNNLLKVLKSGWSFHQTEKFGTEAMANLISVGTKQPILHRSHALRHQNHNTIDLTDLIEDDKRVIKELLPNGWKIEE